MDNKYKLDYDLFSVHEHNSLEHHLAVMIAWFLISWPILLLAWISCRIVGGEEFRQKPFKKQIVVSAHVS